MRKFLTILLLCFIANAANAQQYEDVVYLKNGSIIRGMIIEQIPNQSIKIETSNKNVFAYNMDEIEKITKEPTSRVTRENYFSKKKNKYISIATGYGNSYGGLGVRFQQRFGKILGFGYHGGAGYYPGTSDISPSLFYNGGFKFFWYKAWYLDLSYGTVARYKSNELYNDVEKNLFGPSFLIGGDFFFNHRFGMNGAIGASLNITNRNYSSEYITFDLGFIVKFN